MAVAGEFFELPEPLIQLIQSFLTPKEAAQTTVLSQSWLSAWLTRPNLDFDERDFRYKIDPFLQFAENTFDRYENSNLKIHTFRLRMLHHRRATELISRALRFGPTRLTLNIGNRWCYDLPNDVFASEHLESLILKSCKIDLGPNPPQLGCSGLRSLALKDIKIENRDVLFHMISSCPLLEKLSLSFVFKSYDGGGVRGLGPALFLPRLKSLSLDHMQCRNSFLGEMSSKFPSLEDLTVYMCLGEGQEEMLISSPSLERLDFYMNRCWLSVSNRNQRVKFDVPSIRKLTFRGSIIPSPAIIRAKSMRRDCVSRMHHHPICLTADNVDFLGETFVKALYVRIVNLSQLMYGLNDLTEARAQIFDKGDSMWRDVPLFLDDSTVPDDNRDFRFQLIWQPKHKKKKLN